MGKANGTIRILEAELRAARNRIDELDAELTAAQRNLTKTNTDRMIAQRDSQISAIKIGHLMTKIGRLESEAAQLRKRLQQVEPKPFRDIMERQA